MISCNLQGGLGNQMFQIAATHALALRNGDTSGFNFSACNTPLQGNPSAKYRNNVLANVNDSNGHIFKVNYVEPKFAYDELPYGPDLMLTGYFQSDKYFKDFEAEIKNLFKFKASEEVWSFMKMFYLTGKYKTCVHVRRGDYLKLSDYHQVCSLEYYKEAMKQMGDHLFIFVSDDMGWVKENFKGENIYYSKFTEEIDDFAIMTMCHNVIMSNSSFSWWGAYINDSPTKKVIAPKRWFGPKGPKDTEDLIPSNWSIIDA